MATQEYEPNFRVLQSDRDHLYDSHGIDAVTLNKFMRRGFLLGMFTSGQPENSWSGFRYCPVQLEALINGLDRQQSLPDQIKTAKTVIADANMKAIVADQLRIYFEEVTLRSKTFPGFGGALFIARKDLDELGFRTVPFALRVGPGVRTNIQEQTTYYPLFSSTVSQQPNGVANVLDLVVPGGVEVLREAHDRLHGVGRQLLEAADVRYSDVTPLLPVREALSFPPV